MEASVWGWWIKQRRKWQVIAKILKTNRSITRIDLAGNHISEVGLQAAVPSMFVNRTDNKPKGF